jgi:NADH-quinone oxidoreductase subunit M
MILIELIAILLIGGLLAWVFGRIAHVASRFISILAILVDLFIVIWIWVKNYENISLESRTWLYQYQHPWIERFGINWHFALDGLSLLLLILTFFLGLLSVLVSWSQIKEKVGFFHFNLLWILTGITGVFLSMDLFLFYFFWEIMLIPMYFIIGIWGHENRIYASYKFFIFTQASGLLMFLAILGLYFIHGAQTGNYTFEYEQLLVTSLSGSWPYFLMGGFLIAFLVKLPAVPFHNWLPDAHTEAPTAGSVILAGLLLKTGAYGLLRFVIPIFPEAATHFAPYGLFLGVVSILYGAKLAFAQTDMKRMVAYTSVSHMGFVLLGVFALNQLAYQGVVMQMLAHGISTGALFILVGSIQERLHTRDIEKFGGMWNSVPKMGAMVLLFALASLGLPGLGNFLAEFFILIGSYQVSVFWTALASLGLVAATLYSLRLFQRVFQGKQPSSLQLSDLNMREMSIMILMTLVIVWLGLYPKPVLETSSVPMKKILECPVFEKQVESTDSSTHKMCKVHYTKVSGITEYPKQKKND